MKPAPQAALQAAKTGDRQLLERMLAAGLDPSATDREGFSLLDLAVTEHHNEVVDLLIARRADVNQPFFGSSPLALARDSANTVAFEQLRRAGAVFTDFDIAFREVIALKQRLTSERGLALAIQFGDMDVISKYVRSTYDINASIGEGRAPMHYAALYGTPQTIRYLAKCGADVNARSSTGMPVIRYARGRPEARAALLSLGARDEQ